MYLLAFVNLVRRAQGCSDLDRLPVSAGGTADPLELAMGCRLEDGAMRLRDVEIASAVAGATGLPLSDEGGAVVVPQALAAHSRRVASARAPHGLGAAAT